MAKKYSVGVYEHEEHYGEPQGLIKTIKRKLTAENIGNFNPIFCTYNGKKTLVRSTCGDLSDPFRREACYLDALYIVV